MFFCNLFTSNFFGIQGLGIMFIPCAFRYIIDQDTKKCNNFKHIILSSGPFCCKVGQTPEIIGYYAANLNSGILTVKSANPNAFLFAFINWTYPRAYWVNS